MSSKGIKENFEMCELWLAAPCMMAVITKEEGRFFEVNRSFEHNSGYSRNELIGRTMPECGEMLTSSELIMINETLQKGGIFSNCELTYRTKSGALRVGLFSAEACMLDQKPCVILVVHDTTEQKIACAHLEDRVAMLSSAIESLPCDLFAIGNDGRYMFQNGSSQEMWGEIGGKRPEDIAPDNVALALWQDNNRRAFAGETVKGDVEISIGGEKKHFHNVIAPIHKDNRIWGVSGINIDISERKKIEDALRESEEKYRSLVEDINEVVYSLDENARITYASPNIEELAGYEQSEVLGRPFTDFVYHEDIQGRMDQFKKIMNGANEATEYRMITKSGGIRWVRTAARPIAENGVASGIRGVLMDITDRIEAEERRKQLDRRLLYDRKMEAVGTLAGGVAHDLNNVLTGLVSLPELILRQIPGDSPIKSPLQTIKKSGEKAAAMVQDLLTMARRGVSGAGIVNLNDIIKEYAETPEYGLLKKYHPKVCFEMCLDPDLDNIAGSPVHLSKMVMNLLSNAAEAIENSGTVRIITKNRYAEEHCGRYSQIKEGKYVTLTVLDTGVGMSPVDIERIFEPFYTKKILGRSGTGLGMTVVWGCMQDHKGHIDVETDEGQGSAFTLYFPAVEEALPGKKQQFEEDVCRGNGETILVVDDIGEQREIASMILSSLGYVVSSVAGGEEAVAYLTTSNADVVLLDMIMDPGIDGLETCKRIFDISPDQKVIIVSGYSESAKVKKAKELGARGYVRKPYRIETLARALRQELDSK